MTHDRVLSDATRVSLYLAACAATVGIALALAVVLVPDDLGREAGPIQLCQSAVLVAAAVGAVHRLRADGLSHRLGPVWVAVAFGASWLAWRELELDKTFFDLHAFSWRYLVRRVPLSHKVFFGTLSIGSLAALAWYLNRHWRRFVAGLRQPWPRLPIALCAAGLITLVFGQLWDQSVLFVSSFRTASMDPLPEEMLELVGELLLLCAVVDLNVLARRGHPALADVTPDALNSSRTASAR